MIPRLAFLAFVLTTVAFGGAHGRDLTIVELGPIAALPAGEPKPGAIAFNDRFEEKLVEPVSGLAKFKEWEEAKPFQHHFLSLHPTYSEPMVEVVSAGVKKRYRERLHMYIAEARFVLDKPAASIDLARYASLEFLSRIDPAIKHKAIAAADAMPAKDPRFAYNKHPARAWCETAGKSICIQSRYELEGRLPIGIRLANKLREGSRKIDEFLEFQSELALFTPDDTGREWLPKLTGIATPVAGGLEQSIFYVNQVMQFGRLLAVLQPHPDDAQKSVASVFIALGVESNILGKRTEYANVPVLRNLVPAQVLAGKSSFNTGKSISAGLPIYARNQVKAIAGILAEAAPTR